MRVFLLIFFVSLFIVPQSYAHGGEEHFLLTVNDSPPDVNPVYEATLERKDNTIAQYRSKEMLVVNKPIRFSLSEEAIAEEYPHLNTANVMYTWDFGDGKSGAGMNIAHTYTTSGTRTLSVIGQTDDGEEHTIISVTLDIVPGAPYQLPVAAISVNGVSSKETVEVALQQPVKLEAVLAKVNTNETLSYQWDFGDGAQGQGPRVAHTYDAGEDYAVPVLRVTDANGLFSEAAVTLVKAQHTEGMTFSTSKTGAIILWVEAVVIVIGGTYFLYVLWRHKRKRNKNKKVINK